MHSLTLDIFAGSQRLILSDDYYRNCGFPLIFPGKWGGLQFGAMEFWLARWTVVFSLNMVPAFPPQMLHLWNTNQESYTDTWIWQASASLCWKIKLREALKRFFPSWKWKDRWPWSLKDNLLFSTCIVIPDFFRKISALAPYISGWKEQFPQ